MCNKLWPEWKQRETKSCSSSQEVTETTNYSWVHFWNIWRVCGNRICFPDLDGFGDCSHWTFSYKSTTFTHLSFDVVFRATRTKCMTDSEHQNLESWNWNCAKTLVLDYLWKWYLKSSSSRHLMILRFRKQSGIWKKQCRNCVFF